MQKSRPFLMAAMTALLLATVLILPAQAQAYNFDPSCSATRTSEVELTTPSAMLMLDRSGSMGFLHADYCCQQHCVQACFPFIGCYNLYCWTDCGYNCGPSLWSVAVSAIDQAVAALTSPFGPDDVLFGIGFFPNTYIALEADPNRNNTHQLIVNALNSTGPGGGTPTAQAINVTRNSQTLNDPNRPSAGVLITDGQPCCQSNSRQQALNAACQMRNEGKTLYVVGLGGATDTDFNNKLAAAGGTGCCGPTVNANCSQGIGVDPCVNPNVPDAQCGGSYQAYNQTEFRNALLSIADEVSCTFALDLSLQQATQAPDDPDATWVRMNSTSGIIDIPHRSQNNDQGWYFPNSENRTNVALTDPYCADVRGGFVNTVETQVACDCMEATGTTCIVENPPIGVCPEGAWQCDNGFDICEPLPPSLCPVPCPGAVIGERCHVDNTNHYDHTPHDWSREVNRCKIGEVACVNDEVVCQQIFRPMPEVCNGLDNSCDGRISNMTSSWANPAFEDLQIPASFEYPGAACYGNDWCRCTGGERGVHAGQGASQEAEFQAYLDAYADYIESPNAGCECAIQFEP